MSRNVSGVIDDDIFDKVEQERVKKGVMKSKAINMVLRDHFNNTKKDRVDNHVDNTKLTPKSNDISDTDISTEGTEMNYKQLGKSTPKQPEKEIEKAKEKEKEAPETTENEPITEQLPGSLIKDDLDSRVERILQDITKKAQDTSPKPISIPNLKVTDQSQNQDQTTKFVIKRKNKKVNRLNDEDTSSGMSERDIEHRVNKILEEKKFNETFRDMHNKIQSIDDRVCKDGDCTRNELINVKKHLESSSNELSNIKKDLTNLGKLDNLSKLDTLCEDGKCLKNDLGELRKELGELKKGMKKTEICPGCGHTDVPHLSSYCPECGLEFHGWTDESGNAVNNWKPYKERKKR